MSTPTQQPRLRVEAPDALVLEQSQGSWRVHPLWLRERCNDAASMDPHTRQRLQDPADFAPDLAIVALRESGPGVYSVRFSDGHEGRFAAADILAEAALAPGSHDCPQAKLWEGGLADLPRVQWSAHPGEAQLARWLESYLTLGFVIFTDVPPQEGMVLKVGAQFGFVRETNFGPLFDVRSTVQATDLAYTSLALDPHTDNPYRAPVPGIQLLHCLVNGTDGGLSTLVDGFAVAQALRQEEPAAFAILSHTPVRFRYLDADTELVASAVPIELDVTGAVRAVHYSPRLDFVPLLAPQQLTDYYRARRLFDARLRSDRYQIRFRLERGELVMFDNCRLLHGRTAFDPRQGARHLQGCYIDSDGPRSRYRVLRRALPATAGARSGSAP
ncbi:MAG: TauD/TfdA family dioxygenase [Proteobacteria bacterium]|nr:TauD/TfdA family dioxygenase [Pseudomonadota bacterium]